jgi:hypothetical protein
MKNWTQQNGLSGTTAARGQGMRADRRNITDDTGEVLSKARTAAVPDIFRRMSRIPGDFSGRVNE